MAQLVDEDEVVLVDEDEVVLQSDESVPEAHNDGSSHWPSLANRQLLLSGGREGAVTEAAVISLEDMATTVDVVPRSLRAMLIPVTIADISVINALAAL